MSTAPPTATTPLLAPAYRWATVGMVSLIFLFAFEAMAVTTIMPTVSADLEGRSWYSATFSATLAASIVGMVAAGIWSDRRGPRAPMFASAVVFGIGLLAAGLAPGDRLAIEAPPERVVPGAEVPVTLLRADGEAIPFVARAAIETRLEAELLREGGVLPAILRRTIQSR